MKNLLHHKVHFIGIGGIGMSALAKLLHANGCVVSGSNLEENDQIVRLKERGVEIIIGHEEKNIAKDVVAVVHTSAVNDSNIEMITAKKLDIPTYDYHEYLGLISKQYKTIAISGTHGKSTTTALVAKVLIEAGFDPTVIVGSKIPGFDDNFRAGNSDYLVVEADEFNYGMLHLHPQMLILNNIEADHLDCYGNLENIINSFKKFINQITESGCLIYNADDKNVLAAIDNNKIKKIGVGVNNGDVKYVFSQNSVVTVDNEKFTHQLWGEYNDANLAMAISLANFLQADKDKIKTAIKEFSGLWRRFEVLTTNALDKKITLISDYAHHPTALAGIIKAAQKRYASSRVWTIFQPHHYDRVSNFFFEFVEALKLANNPVIVKTYDVPGREGDGVRKKTSRDIADLIDGCVYLDDVLMVEEFVKNTCVEGDVVVAIGAGTIDGVIRKIV